MRSTKRYIPKIGGLAAVEGAASADSTASDSIITSGIRNTVFGENFINKAILDLTILGQAGPQQSAAIFNAKSEQNWATLRAAEQASNSLSR